MRTRIITLYAIAAGVIVVDQLTKLLAVEFLQGEPRIAVVGNLAGLTFLRNPGAAFGLGSNATWVFSSIAIAVFAAIVALSKWLRSTGWAVGLGLLLGGLTGNLLDRFFRMPANGEAPQFMHGAVVDFIDLYFFVCNVADIAITSAAVLIALLTLLGYGLDGKRTGTKEAAA